METDTSSTPINVEIDMDHIVAVLVKAKQKIQYLSAISETKVDIEEIKDLLEEICSHERISDWIDIDPEKSIHIEFCPKCETIFKNK